MSLSRFLSTGNLYMILLLLWVLGKGTPCPLTFLFFTRRFFSNQLRKAEEHNGLRGIWVALGASTIWHVLFDDIVLLSQKLHKMILGLSKIVWSYMSKCQGKKYIYIRRLIFHSIVGCLSEGEWIWRLLQGCMWWGTTINIWGYLSFNGWQVEEGDYKGG